MHRGPEAFLEVCRNKIKIRLVILVVRFPLADFSCILLGFCSARTEKKKVQNPHKEESDSSGNTQNRLRDWTRDCCA